jgi:hypothetical protein
MDLTPFHNPRALTHLRVLICKTLDCHRLYFILVVTALDAVAPPRLTCCFPKGSVRSFLLETKMAVL